MTCLEKYLQDNPTFSADEVVGDFCPNITGGIDIPDPEFCIPRTGENCVRCWNREIPGTEEPHIRDSGSRTEFSTGAVRDIQKGKGRCDLMPLDVVGHILNNPTLAFIYQFQTSGIVQHLMDALTSSGVYHDIHTMLLEVSKHFEEGAEKYGENNWQKGLPAKCYINSAVRHYLKYLRGDTDEHHDRAFCWNIICACWTCKHRPELNDYAPGKLGFNPDDFIGEYEEEND